MTNALLALMLSAFLAGCSSPSVDLSGRQWGGLSKVVGEKTR